MLSHCTRHYFDLHVLIYPVQYKLTALSHAHRTTIYCTHAHHTTIYCTHAYHTTIYCTHAYTQLTFINKVQKSDMEAVLHDKNVYVRSCNKTQRDK